MGIQVIRGTLGNRAEERIIGTAGDDWIYPLGGYDFIDGGAGEDRVWVTGISSQFKLIPSGNAVGLIDATSAASPMGATLINVEEIAFSDRVVRLNAPDSTVDQAGRSDAVTGGTGVSTVIYSQERAAYDLSRAGRYWKVIERKEMIVDTLESVERIRFKDKIVALDLETAAPGSAAKDAAQLLAALFSSRFFSSTTSEAVTGQVIRALDLKTHSETDIAQLAIDLNLVAGSEPDQRETFIRNIVGNVLEQTPAVVSADLVAGLSALIKGPTKLDAPYSQAEFIALASDYVQLTGLLPFGLEYSI